MPHVGSGAREHTTASAARILKHAMAARLTPAVQVGMCRPELAEATIPYRIISPFLPDPDAVVTQKPGCGKATYNYLSR